MKLKTSRIALVLAAIALLAAADAACAKKVEPTVTAPAVDAGPKGPPVDHLAPGELVEGTDKVFALVIPRVMRIERQFDDVAYVVGPIPPEPVAKYIEARVREGTVKVKPEGHVFENVHVIGESKPLHIVVSKGLTGSGARIVIRDVTPRSTVGDPPDEESRWRAVGLSPNGKVLDPTKLH